MGLSEKHVAQAKELARRVVKHPDPENDVPVVTVNEWLANIFRNPVQGVISYFVSLFPIFSWIHRYNLGWLSGDVVAGLTVGLVLVPQGMSYAQIATLPAEYGLYSSFVGVVVYCFFATSKDVSIGPVAVMSLTVSQIIKAVDSAHPGEWSGPQIATTVAFVCGFIVLGIGLLRLGWLVEFIPAPAVSGFMTGSAISIVSGQVPTLMGITGFDTRAATFHVIIDTLKGLPRTKLDAAFGLTALVVLYLVRWGLQRLSERFPRKARVFFFISVMRNGVIIIILTIASWLYCRHRADAKGKYPIKILLTVPRGFQHAGRPVIDPTLISALAGQLPVATIILLLEHIAIAKSFGRVNGYKINANQELIGIGVTNTIGTLLGAYPSTGSFSRSALQSKSGSRSPLAGLFSAIVVIVALYGLTPAFFWIPSASLAAVIIHAVADLVASPAQVYSFWRVSPLEFIIWFASVLTTVFATIEDGIYLAITASLVLLLVRLARPRGSFLGKVTMHLEGTSREAFAPLKPNPGVMNPGIHVREPTPGVVVYRFEESYLYPNCSLVNDAIVEYVKLNTRRGKDMTTAKASDRPWNDPGTSSENSIAALKRPLLHAVVLDFSAVSHIDTTGIQSLLDTRHEVERWADRPVEFHFSSILSPWIRRALVAAEFGTGKPHSNMPLEIAPVTPYRQSDMVEAIEHDRYETQGKLEDPENGILEIPTGPNRSSTLRSEVSDSKLGKVDVSTDEISESRDTSGRSSPETRAGGSRPGTSTRSVSTIGENEPLVPAVTPFFHFDLHAAVRAAETGVMREPTVGDTIE